MNKSKRKAQWAREIGRRAEDAVLSAFLAKGYIFVTRNYLVHQRGELDLVFRKKMCLYMVEVKSRHECNAYGGCMTSISRMKILRMHKAAQIFIMDASWRTYDVCFVAGLVTHGSDGMIRKIEFYTI
jgi:Holliday junction resolvase-like predicted endonuclease